MRKPIEQMTEREMLTELLLEKRRRENWLYVKLGFYALVLIVLVVLGIKYLPPVIDFFRRLDQSLQQIRQSLQQLQSASDSVRDTVSNLRDSGAEALRDAVDKLNELLQNIPGIFR